MQVLTNDSKALVISPLRRLLEVVFSFARNPLDPVTVKEDVLDDDIYESPSCLRRLLLWMARESTPEDDMMDYFETEQLTKTIQKITNMLKVCWGIAGARIISDSLDSGCNFNDGFGDTITVFNRGEKGRPVYAIFGFFLIDEFDFFVASLGEDVILMINDVASIVHTEVKRWGYLNSGACNKNLGNTFLMVWRIGDFSRVEREYKKAAEIVFGEGASPTEARGTSMRSPAKGRRSKAASLNRPPSDRTMLNLSHLPGITDFCDRAIVGALKAFAKLHRDRNIHKWRHDERLVSDRDISSSEFDGNGGFFSSPSSEPGMLLPVPEYDIQMAIGMSAGWAMEGAVGSNNKIDATYLSPHVNNAARMMAACKQYNVHMLMNGDVQELASNEGKSMLRHVDTVIVKGSSVPNKLYTFDCKSKGVQFFMNSRSENTANQEACDFNENCWRIDKDLLNMSRHATDKFRESFEIGRVLYEKGMWNESIDALENANDIMRKSHEDAGWDEENELIARKRKQGSGGGKGGKKGGDDDNPEWNDGPSQALLRYMRENMESMESGLISIPVVRPITKH
jgi:hypothetical protein